MVEKIARLQLIARVAYRLDEYQGHAMKTAIYPDEISAVLAEIAHHPEVHAQITMLMRLNYVAAGLAGEAGEFNNKVKKLIRDSGGHLSGHQRKELGLELGGALWYLATSAKELGYALSDIADMNRVQLANRQESGTLKGSGDNR